MIKIIGHRGLPEFFPENTLLSFQEALKAGADAIECDIQMSACGVPFVFHDAALRRVCDVEKHIYELDKTQLQHLSAHEKTRFGERFFPTPIAELRELSGVLAQYPGAKLFAEIKEESFAVYSREYILDKVIHALYGVLNQVVVISYDLDILELARSKYSAAMGWVLREYDEHTERQAIRTSPDFLFCNVDKLPSFELWSGDWQWAVYDVVDVEQAKALGSRGIFWIESWNARDLKRALATHPSALTSD